MKIAYIIDTDISSQNSIVDKVNTKVKLWEKNNIEVKVFSLISEKKTSILKNGVVCEVKANSKFTYINAVKSLKIHLENFSPDIIYSRYIRYVPGLVEALKVTNKKYIVEINTNDVEENKLSSLKKRIYNILTRSFLLKNASGFVYVTNELKNNQDFLKFKKKNLVLSNGINTSDFEKHISTKKANPNHLVLIGTAGQDWQGFEKIIYLAKKLKQFNFDLIGVDKKDMLNLGISDIPENIILHGFLPLEKNKEIIAKAVIGIGTLSLYKKNMNEACALKIRQYLAQGIPVILGNKDTDLMNKNLDFVLEIENTEDNIEKNIKNIKTFIDKVQEYNPQKIVNFSQQYLDAKGKEKIRLNFIESILNDY